MSLPMPHLRQIVSPALMVALAMAGASGCANDLPTEELARAVLDSMLQDQVGEAVVAIESFEKLDGQESESDGVQQYKLEFVATVKWPQGVNTECLGNDENFKGWNCWMKETRPVNHIDSVGGVVYFEKTENGWRGWAETTRELLRRWW